MKPGALLSVDKKNVAYWVLYDFGNSVSSIAFYLYYSQWLVVDRGLSDFEFNMIFVGSSALLLLAGPALGLAADKKRLRLPYLRWVTLANYLFYLGASLIAICAQIPVWAGALCFLMANFSYQLSLVFYTPLLADISPPDRRGLISGLGQAGNWLGQIAGILLCLPFLSNIALAGPPGRVQAFLPATLTYVVLSLPMILLFKMPVASQNSKQDGGVCGEGFLVKWRELRHVPGIIPFFVAYFFFSDAFLTININFPIYLNQVWHLTDKTKSLIMLMILVMSAAGSAASGWLADRYGLRRSMILVLLSFCVILPVVAVQKNFSSFRISMMIFSIFFGAVFTITRALLTRLCPNEKLNFASSFYVLFERVATFIGPIAWGVVVSGLSSLGAARYRWAFGTMAVFVLIGAMVATKVPGKSDAPACDPPLQATPPYPVLPPP